MKIKEKKRKIFDVFELGSLSDLAFLLIIFFIVITIFNINKGFLLSLQQEDSLKIINVKDIIKIILKSNDEIFYMEESITMDELEKQIKKDLIVNPNLTILLKIEEDVKYQNFVSIIEIARKSDVENFSFNMIKKK